MQLKYQVQQGVLDAKQLTASLKWTTAADFDLAAAYESKDGKRGLVYFGDLGQLDAFPYIHLKRDEGVGDLGGHKKEDLIINNLEVMNSVWLFCWDYSMVQEGRKARFKESDVSLTISDESGNHTNIEIETGEKGNVCYFASIDNSHPKGAKLTNTRLAGTLLGLKTIEQLMALVRYQAS
jgi:tellurite resistance protein TerA